MQENAVNNNNNNPIPGVLNVNNNNLPNASPTVATAATNPNDGISQGNNKNILDSTTATSAENVTNNTFADGSATS